MTSLAIRDALKAKLQRAHDLNESAADRGFNEDEQREYDALLTEIRNLRSRLDDAAVLAPVGDDATDAAAAAEARDGKAGDAELRAAAKPAGTAAPRVSVNETSPYDQRSATHSWFGDLKAASQGDSEARERMAGVAREERALSSTDAQGGYLVPPMWMQNEFVDLRAKAAVAAGIVNNLALPANTDSINLPTMDGATAVAASTENAALTETSATFNTVAASVYRVGGQQKIPNTLIDRSMPAIDQIILRDLAKRLAIQVDTWVLAGTGSSQPTGLTAQSGKNTTTFTAGVATPAGLYAALVKQATNIATTNHETDGLVYVMHGRRWGWYLGQVDGSNRPFITALAPQNNPAVASGFPAAGLVGYTSTGHPVYVDNNITTTNGAGTDEDQIICMVAAEQYLFNGTPKFAVSTDAAFSNDQTVVRATQDIAFTAGRRPLSIDVMSGTGLNDVL